MPCQGFIYIKHIEEGDFWMINECLFLCVYQHLQNPALVQQILTFIFWRWSAENCWHKMIKFRRALAISHKCTRIYIFLFDRSIIGSSLLVRAGLMHWICADLRSALVDSVRFSRYTFHIKRSWHFLKYLQHRSEGLPKLIWSWNWLYVQFF